MTLQKIELLYLEDDELDRRAFVRLVREKALPWKVTYAETLDQARAALAAGHFDVIVADYHLPDGNSTQLFENVPETPFVLLTGTLEEELALRTLERGADDYMAKDPVLRHLDALPFTVEKTLHRKHIRDRERELTRKLRESEQELRATVENAASGIMRIDGEGRLVAVNNRLCEMLGYSREELLSRSVHELTYAEDRPRTEEVNAQLRDGRLSVAQYEKRYIKRDGAPLWVHLAISSVRDEVGHYLYSIATVVDISARKAAEEQLHLHAAALAAAPNAISLSKSDPLGTIEWVNPAFTELTGYSAKEVIGRSHHVLSSGVQGEHFYRNLWATIRRGDIWRGELVNRRKDGTIYHEEMAITPLRDEAGRISHYVAIKQDVSPRKRAEERLRASEERFRALVIASSDALYCMSPDWTEMRQLKGGTFITDTDLPAKDWIQRYLVPEDREHTWAVIQQAIRNKGIFELEHRVVRKDGSVGWAFSRAVPVFDRAGEIMEWFGAATDITEARERALEAAAARKEAERLNAELAEALSTKDQFIAVISHELRTPLTAMVAALSVMRSASNSNDRVRRAIEILERNTKVQTRLIDDLLDLSRMQRQKLSLQRAPTRLDRAVCDVAHAMEADAANAGVHLSVDVEPDLWVQGDADRLQQVLVNLLANAIKFTASGGDVTVRACRATHVARVSVSDTGIGIDRAILDDIFSPFRQGEIASQSKPGLGLGLALVRGLVEAHGGRVWAESEGFGKGSRFVAELPLIQASQESAHAASGRRELAPIAGQIRLLLVEDNQDTRELLQAELETHGYAVEAVRSGEEALSILRRAKPDILLSDIQMPPGMNGYELLRRARELPGMAEVPAFAVTAYGQEEDVRLATAAGFSGHFTKPVNIRVLDRRIRELVEARP